MKVSGSHFEKIRAWTNMGYEAAESATIQATVEKLAKEGKKVINIIHGNKTMIGGDYVKTITFLWEGDDEDIQQKSAELDKIAAQNAIIKEKINRLETEISSLKERIDWAKKNVDRKINKQSQSEYVKKERRDNIKVGLYALVVAIPFIGLGYLLESFIFTALGVIVSLISLFGFYMGLSKKEKSEIENKIKKGECDLNNLSDLSVQLVKKQKEIEDLKRQLK